MLELINVWFMPKCKFKSFIGTNSLLWPKYSFSLLTNDASFEYCDFDSSRKMVSTPSGFFIMMKKQN